MTGRPALGDFLRGAHHIPAAQPGMPPPRREDVQEVSRSLLRVVIILGRYLHDTATIYNDLPRRGPAPATPWGQARCQAHEALTNAAASLQRSGTPLWPPGP